MKGLLPRLAPALAGAAVLACAVAPDASAALAPPTTTPATNVTFIGNSNSTCFVTIALTITFNGNSTMSGSKTACGADGVTGPAVTNIALTQ